MTDPRSLKELLYQSGRGNSNSSLSDSSPGLEHLQYAGSLKISKDLLEITKSKEETTGDVY